MVSGVSMESTRRMTAQPCKVAARYFSASFMKPWGVRCRPRFHTLPSISIRSCASSHAKSARQRRLLSNRYSRTNSGPPMASHRVANRFSSSELLRLCDTPLGAVSKSGSQAIAFSLVKLQQNGIYRCRQGFLYARCI